MKRFETLRRKDMTQKAGKSVEALMNNVQRRAEDLRDSASHAAKKARHTMKDVHRKTEDVIKDIKVGSDEIKKSIKGRELIEKPCCLKGHAPIIACGIGIAAAGITMMCIHHHMMKKRYY